MTYNDHPDRIGTRNGLAIEGPTHETAACGIMVEVEGGVTQPEVERKIYVSVGRAGFTPTSSRRRLTSGYVSGESGPRSAESTFS